MNRLCVLVRKLYGHSFVRFAAVGGVGNGRQLRDLCDPDPQF